MNKLNKQALQKLLKIQADLAVTIYVPMHTSAAPPHTKANQTRLKNLSHQAIDELKDLRNYDLATFLETQIIRLHDDLEFLKGESPGILICATEDFFKVYSLPVNTEEYHSIDKQFYLAPIIGLMSDAQEYYVLELADHNPKLLIGDMYSLQATTINLPVSMRDSNAIYFEDRKHHSIDYSLKKGYPDRFFKIVDNIIIDHTNHNLPLIVAGTETDTAAFKNISRYPKLINQSLTNGYDSSRMEELFEKTKDIIEQELIMPRHRSVIEEYLRLEQSDPNRISQNEQTMIRAAEDGRVDKLITTMSRETTDNVQDDISHATTCITFWEPRVNRLMNKLAVSVWQMKGMVLNLRPNEMPNGEHVVAELRY